jgi:hypothetical protein
MPLTPFQAEVLGIIAANRSIESHIAGGVALNSSPDSPRYSEDIDIFHDAEEAIAVASEKDCASLAAAGVVVVRQLWEPAYRRVWAERGSDGVKIEWAQDAAWRFFPVQADPVLQWRLHPFDALANKALAMGARAETRDLVDIVSHASQFPLHAVVWAACGKDPGWTPLLLLEQMRRNARVEPSAIAEMKSTIEPTKLKIRWLQLSEDAETKLLQAAGHNAEIGVAFLSPDGTVVWHEAPGATAQRPTLGGVLPRLAGFHYPVD